MATPPDVLVFEQAVVGQNPLSRTWCEINDLLELGAQFEDSLAGHIAI